MADEPTYDYVERGKVERLTTDLAAARSELADALRREAALKEAADRMAEAIEARGPLDILDVASVYRALAAAATQPEAVDGGGT